MWQFTCILYIYQPMFSVFLRKIKISEQKEVLTSKKTFAFAFQGLVSPSQGIALDVVPCTSSPVVHQLLLLGQLRGPFGARNFPDLHRLGALRPGDLWGWVRRDAVCDWGPLDLYTGKKNWAEAQHRYGKPITSPCLCYIVEFWLGKTWVILLLLQLHISHERSNLSSCDKPPRWRKTTSSFSKRAAGSMPASAQNGTKFSRCFECLPRAYIPSGCWLDYACAGLPLSCLGGCCWDGWQNPRSEIWRSANTLPSFCCYHPPMVSVHVRLCGWSPLTEKIHGQQSQWWIFQSSFRLWHCTPFNAYWWSMSTP